MSVIPLLVSAYATFISDGSGGSVARVILGPQIYGTKWNVTRIVSITNSTGTLGMSQLLIYRNNESPSNYFDGTRNADQDTNELTQTVVLTPGDNLVFVWTKGDIGAVATVVLSGTADTGR